jgi:hypothetical protein
VNWRRPWYEYVLLAVALWMLRDLAVTLAKEAIYIATGRLYP